MALIAGLGRVPLTAPIIRLITAVVFLCVVAAPHSLEAQAARKVWRVGILATANPRVYDDVVDELRTLGYVEGQNLAVVVRSAEGKGERLPALAAGLVRAGVDVIVAGGGDAALRAALHATATVPIVMVAIDYDPVALGLVASLGRPGGNVTGVSLQQIELTAKRMELLKATLPNLTRVAILWDTSAPDQFKAAEAASRFLGLRVQSLRLGNPVDEFRGAFATAVKDHADALFVVTTAIFFRERVQIAQLAMSNRLPAVFPRREFVDAGGLMSYGPNVPEMFRRAAIFVDRILKGAKPADLPVEQPTKFEMLVNLKAAKALGLTVPQSVLARADHVIR